MSMSEMEALLTYPPGTKVRRLTPLNGYELIGTVVEVLQPSAMYAPVLRVSFERVTPSHRSSLDAYAPFITRDPVGFYTLASIFTPDP